MMIQALPSWLFDSCNNYTGQERINVVANSDSWLCLVLSPSQHHIRDKCSNGINCGSIFKVIKDQRCQSQNITLPADGNIPLSSVVETLNEATMYCKNLIFNGVSSFHHISNALQNIFCILCVSVNMLCEHGHVSAFAQIKGHSIQNVIDFQVGVKDSHINTIVCRCNITDSQLVF
jgi:hypothetical protein